MSRPIFTNEELCTGCESCIDICPRDSLALNEKGIIEMVNDRCHSCGHCISICPESALSHMEFPMDEYQEISDYLDSSMLNGEQLVYLLKSIRSTRKFKDKPIDEKILKDLLDVTRYSPTGHHSQNIQVHDSLKQSSLNL